MRGTIIPFDVRIVATEGLTEDQRKTIAQAAPRAELADRRCRTPEDYRAVLEGGCDVLLASAASDEVLRLAPDLKWIQLLSAGVDGKLGDQAYARGLVITTASGIHAATIAEYILALMLGFAHRLELSIRAQGRAEWTPLKKYMSSCFELRGKTLGIVGYGSIGRELARIAQHFGMTILALKRRPDLKTDSGWIPEGLGDAGGLIPKRWFGPDQREQLLAASDFIAVTLPLTEATRSFIGARELQVMKPGAFLVNVGRGEVIEERALERALREGKLGGAGIDVFEQEPLPADSPLWGLERLIITPHMAGASRLYYDRACTLFADNLQRFQEGRPLFNQLDPEHRY